MARLPHTLSGLSLAALLLGCSAASARPTPLSGSGQMCGGIAGLRCGAGLACVMTVAAHPDQAGTCQAPHDDGGRAMCSQIYRPVCGADGKSYPNRCIARSRGATVTGDGACEAPPAPKP